MALVRSGAERRRLSNTFAFRRHENFGAPRVEVRDGDFAGALTLDALRSCLGPDWTETHASARYETYGDAWVFSRAGQPLVMYVQSRDDGYNDVEMRITIEPAE